MNGDWIFVVFLTVSFVLIIIAASLEQNAASLVDKHSSNDNKLTNIVTCLQISTGLSLGIGISGLIFVMIAILLLAFVPLVLAILGLFPAKMLGKVIYGIIIIALGVTVILISSLTTHNIQTSDTYVNADDDSQVKHDLDQALNYNMVAFGLFIGLVVFLFILFLGMAIYDVKKSRESTENLVNEAVQSLLKMSERTFKKVRSKYDNKPKFAEHDSLDVNPLGTMADRGLDKIVELTKSSKKSSNISNNEKPNLESRPISSQGSNRSLRKELPNRKSPIIASKSQGSYSADTLRKLKEDGAEFVDAMITGSEKMQDAIEHGRRMSKRSRGSYSPSDLRALEKDSEEFVDAMITGSEKMQDAIEHGRRMSPRTRKTPSKK